MQISVSEKSRWVSDLIFRELRRFEEDTKVAVEGVTVKRLDDQITGVNLEMKRSDCYGS